MSCTTLKRLYLGSSRQLTLLVEQDLGTVSLLEEATEVSLMSGLESVRPLNDEAATGKSACFALSKQRPAA